MIPKGGVGGMHVDTIIDSKDTTYNIAYGLPQEKYLARYKVLQVVQGKLKSDTIDFLVFSHNGQPGPMFGYENVLLFVYSRQDTFYQENYQYFDVYRTDDSRWAGAYSSRDYDGGYEHVTVKPERIKFKTPPVYTLESDRPDWIQHVYPSPYYNLNNGKATAVYGNYVEDLCKLRQQTVIRARRATDR
ncbi:MAG: hypothetical protein JSS76_18060 [Bacteroidetes bacterium]|nr:hypothetical protein [Bacteroidota bacterium]